MPRRMPPLASQFAKDVDLALTLAQVGEIILAAAGKRSVAWRELRPARLEALYEAAYLRIFISWELFLEESFVRCLCGYASAAGPASLRQQACRTINDGRSAVLSGHPFVSWADPLKVEQRSQAFIQNGLHELVVRASIARLQAFAAIRHRIAHGSAHARRQFDIATMRLAGRRYRGASPGRFLRDWNHQAVPPDRWIQTVGGELKNLALQILP